MTKTKFLSKVLAVLMALSMLCSTGVLADYPTGELTADPAIITITEMTLNGTLNLNEAIDEATAKWADIADGIEIDITGTASQGTGTVAFVIAPTAALQDPVDTLALEATMLGTATATIENGGFTATIQADTTKIVAGETYELRYAYSEVSSAEDTYVYQRYIKTFDWNAEGTTQATRTITKDGIADPISITIQSNPLRDAMLGNSKVAKQSITHIRTDNLDDGAHLQFRETASIPDGFKFAGEDSAAQTTPAMYEAMLDSVGAEFKGGVLLSDSMWEPYKYNTQKTLEGNAGWRFQATEPGTAYIVAGAPLTHSAWTNVNNGEGECSFTDIRPPLFVTREVTVAEADADSDGTLTGTEVGSYLKTNSDLVTQDPEKAVGFYQGTTTAWKLKSATFYPLSMASTLPNNSKYGIMQMPKAADGSAYVNTQYPYYMHVTATWNYVAGRGYTGNPLDLKYAYKLSFNAGDWVEIPYISYGGSTGYQPVVLQFDAPPVVETKPELTTANITSTLAPTYTYSFTQDKIARNETPVTTETVSPVKTETGYDVIVPYGTQTVVATLVDSEDNASVETTVDLSTVDSKTVQISIGDFTYDVTFKWNASAPYIYNVAYNGTGYSYPKRNAVVRGGQYLHLQQKISADWDKTSSGSKSAGASETIATPSDAMTSIKIGGQALANNAYLTMIVPSNSDSLYRTWEGTNTKLFSEVVWTENENWTSFTPSAAGTVYVRMSHANVTADNYVWKEVASDNTWVKVTNAKLGEEDIVVYKKTFAANETVSIPTQVITDEELAYVNAELQKNYPADNGTAQFKYAKVADVNFPMLHYATDGKAYDDAAKSWTAVPANTTKSTAKHSVTGADGNTISVMGEYMRGGNSGVGTFGSPLFIAVAFDAPSAPVEPFEMGDITYTYAGLAEPIVVDKESVEPITVPYGTEAISVSAAYTGAGTVVVSPETVTLTDDAPSQMVTVTATPDDGEAETYTLTFVLGAPKLTWTSALALTGTPKTQTTGGNTQAANTDLYAGGLYKVGQKTGEAQLNTTTVDIKVPYGVEAVAFDKLIEGKIDLLNAPGHSVTTTLEWAGTTYTVNIAWEAYAYQAGMPLLYDLQYHVENKSNLAGGGTWYYAVPSALVLNNTIDLVNTEDTFYKDADKTEPVETFTEDSYNKSNYTVTNAGAHIRRIRIAPRSFQSFADAGYIKNTYAFNDATVLVVDYNDATADEVSPRYTFKAAVDGYVIAAYYENQNVLDGWTKYDDVEIEALNRVSRYNEEGTKENVYTIETQKYVYVKKVKANEEVNIIETNSKSTYPPIVMVVTEDMFTEKEFAKLTDLKYSTAATLYKVATVTDASINIEGPYDVKVPYGTASATVTYTLEDGTIATTDAVDLLSGKGSVDIPAPAGTIKVNFTWNDAPESQYISNLVKNDIASRKDRIFVTYGDHEGNVKLFAKAGHAEDGESTFFMVEGDRTKGIAQRGQTVIISDAINNCGNPLYGQGTIPYLYAEQADYLSFTLGRAGYVYVVPYIIEGGVWKEGVENQWTVAPFTFDFNGVEKVVYQKHYDAGAQVTIPSNVVTQAEIDAENLKVADEGYEFVKLTDTELANIKAAATATGVSIKYVQEGDWVAKYLTENPEGANYAGYVPQGSNGVKHYTRPTDGGTGNTLTFAVADAYVDEAFRKPQYKGDATVKSGTTIDLAENTLPIYYGEVGGEITFELADTTYATLEGSILTVKDAVNAESHTITITATQRGVSSTFTITTAELSVNEYGYLTILANESGKFTVDAKDDEKDYTLEDSGNYGKTYFKAGETVTLTAVPAEGYVFKYWKRLKNASDTGHIFSYDASFVLTIPNDIILAPVFAPAELYSVTFRGYQQSVIEESWTDGTDIITVPSEAVIPQVFGYKFDGFALASDPETVVYAAGVSIPAGTITKDTVFVAVYVQDENQQQYTLTVENGTIEGTEETSITAHFNTRVVVMAEEVTEEGNFQYWADADDLTKKLSYSATYTFYMMAADRTLVAVYAPEDQVIEPVYTMTVSQVGEDANGVIFGLFAERRIPEGYTVIENGIVYAYEGNDYGFTTESKVVDLDNWNGMAKSKFQNSNGSYFIRFQMTADRASKPGAWYASTYVTVKDGSDKVVTFYSPKTKIAVEDEPVEEPEETPTEPTE